MVSNRRCNPPTTRTPHTTHVSVGARTRPRVAQYPLPLPLTLAHSLPRSFSLSFTPRAEPHRIPRDKTKPGRVPSFIRGRGAASGSSAPRLDRSVYPAKLSAPPSLRAFDQFSTLLHPPLPSSSSTTPARRFPTTTWSRHPSIHDRTPGGSGLPEYFIYSPPASSSSPP